MKRILSHDYARWFPITYAVLLMLFHAILSGCRFIALGCIVCMVLIIAGCAAGRADDGSIIIGAKVAQLPETAAELAKAASGFLPPPWNFLASGAASLILGGGAVGVAAKRSKAREDAAFDEGQARAYAAAAPPHWSGVGPDPTKEVTTDA